MKKIGGNTFAMFQTKVEGERNKIGECEHTWVDALTIKGWLDLSNGDSKRTIYSAKIQESTHMFLCDYLDLMMQENAALKDSITDTQIALCEIYEAMGG